MANQLPALREADTLRNIRATATDGSPWFHHGIALLTALRDQLSYCEMMAGLTAVRKEAHPLAHSIILLVNLSLLTDNIKRCMGRGREFTRGARRTV